MLDKMKERIKFLREKLGKSQEEFGKELGLSRNYISLVENGQRNLSDQSLKVLCSLYSVNEEWVRTGKGNMEKSRTKNQEVFDFANKVMDLPDKKFKKRFIEALAKLDERDWECLEKIVLEITKEG